jgi:hypothetical protein
VSLCNGRELSVPREPDPNHAHRMANTELRKAADERFREALERTGARDPRDFYRERLRELRDSEAAAYRQAPVYYEDRLIPAVASSGSDPIAEWLEYGCLLARLASPGRTVQVEPTGLATDYERPVAGEAMVLHIPDSARERPTVVGLPPEMSPAQRATYDLLVARRRG